MTEIESCAICYALDPSPRILVMRQRPADTAFDDIPVHSGCVRDWAPLLDSACNPAELVVTAAGEATWNPTGNAVPNDTLRVLFALGLAEGATEEATATLRKVQTAKTIEDYRAHRAENGYSAEELAGMRAAFGEGVPVVDVITDERIQL